VIRLTARLVRLRAWSGAHGSRSDVDHEHDRFAVDKRPLHIEAANRLSDSDESISEVRPRRLQTLARSLSLKTALARWRSRRISSASVTLAPPSNGRAGMAGLDVKRNGGRT
jgi:hypothetical protein